MTYQTLVEQEALSQHLHDPAWRIFDCRNYLTEPGRGLSEFEQAHIPNASYLNLEDDLSGPIISGVTGRHPLPDPAQFAQRLGQWGVDHQTQVIVYDQGSGAIAARLWWMLRWLGHDKVAVLNGGWAAWARAGLPVTQAEPSFEARVFLPKMRSGMTVSAQQIESGELKTTQLVDSRERARYLGEVEPIDKVAGHIPGAINAPFMENLDPNGCFLSQEHLRERFGFLDPQRKPVFYCGSGVTAAHNILAYQHAGLGDAFIYPGSWSEWIAPGTRAIATGEERL